MTVCQNHESHKDDWSISEDRCMVGQKRYVVQSPSHSEPYLSEYTVVSHHRPASHEDPDGPGMVLLEYMYQGKRDTVPCNDTWPRSPKAAWQDYLNHHRRNLESAKEQLTRYDAAVVAATKALKEFQ